MPARRYAGTWARGHVGTWASDPAGDGTCRSLARWSAWSRSTSTPSRRWWPPPWPRSPTNCGLYEGIPLTSRGSYTGASPDRITLFLATICRSAGTTEDLVRQVRVTLLHEVGHHFGIDDERLDDLGWS